jgi:inosine-uridine nucleoside N-ribohydrolase
MPVIFDTDLGNDVDDAIAMDILYKYADEGKIDILAEGISKDGLAPAEYMDILNNWYGYSSIPIGIVLNGADCETDAVNYAMAVNVLNDESGAPLFKRTGGMDYASLPETHIMYRKVLSESEDNSVTLVTVGFSTNLARLLDTPADAISPLTGRELVAAKVKNLVMMAGCFYGSIGSEYNVWKDIPAAQKVISEWPTPVVFAPFELGIQVCYPATSIENDFAWTEHHPVVEAYKAYLPMPYDRPCWDPAALVYAVEGDRWFGVSAPGTISISDGGTTTFEESETGRHTYLTVSPEQAAALTDRIVEIVTRPL